MARASKEHILNEIRRLADENGGAPLGRERFEAASGIRESEWIGHHWARWSDVVRDAGYEPNKWSAEKLDDGALLLALAEAARKLGRIPTTPDLRLLRKTNPDVPNESVIRNRFGGKPGQVERLLAFTQAHPDYADVAALCVAGRPRKIESRAAEPEKIVTGVVYLLRMAEYYKIGKSNDAGRRSYELGIQLPEKHDLIHVVETDDPSGIEVLAQTLRPQADQRRMVRPLPGRRSGFHTPQLHVVGLPHASAPSALLRRVSPCRRTRCDPPGTKPAMTENQRVRRELKRPQRHVRAGEQERLKEWIARVVATAPPRSLERQYGFERFLEDPD